MLIDEHFYIGFKLLVRIMRTICKVAADEKEG